MKVFCPGFYEWFHRPVSRKALENKELLTRIRQIHKHGRRTYGIGRIDLEPRKEGIRLGHGRIRRIAREARIRCKRKTHFKATTDSAHTLAVAPNIPDRRFDLAKAPGEVWCADITYIPVGGKWLYLTAVKDLFHNGIIGWSMDSRMTKELCLGALSMAKNRVQPKPGLIHHSDRGSQYASKAYQEALEKTGAVCSMSRKGNCWDNAPMESFFDKLKTESLNDYRFRTHAEAKAVTFEYIEVFYNRIRIQEKLGGFSPAEFKEAWRKREFGDEVKLVAA